MPHILSNPLIQALVILLVLRLLWEITQKEARR